MLTVEAYELVRRKYHLDGMSISPDYSRNLELTAIFCI